MCVGFGTGFCSQTKCFKDIFATVTTSRNIWILLLFRSLIISLQNTNVKYFLKIIFIFYFLLCIRRSALFLHSTQISFFVLHIISYYRSCLWIREIFIEYLVYYLTTSFIRSRELIIVTTFCFEQTKFLYIASTRLAIYTYEFPLSVILCKNNSINIPKSQ